MTTSCHICRGEIAEPDEEPNACPHCGAVALVVGPDWNASETRARAAYHNDSLAARTCDHCGAWYRGPAVYCSLDCALADA